MKSVIQKCLFEFSQNIIIISYLDAYNISAKSSAFSEGKYCEIVINGSPNLCQNKRGHNIVVIDKVKNKNESVNFDIFKSEYEVCYILLSLLSVWLFFVDCD